MCLLLDPPLSTYTPNTTHTTPSHLERQSQHNTTQHNTVQTGQEENGDGCLRGEEHGKACDDSSHNRISGGGELIIIDGGVRGGDREGDELPVVRNGEGGGANEGVLRRGDRNQGATAGVPVLLHWSSS